MKSKYDEKVLLKHLPHEMLEFHKHISSLDYYERPDYQVGKNCKFRDQKSP